MTNGDAAAAAGLDVVAGTADIRNAYDEINKSRDYIANHKTSGTHVASAINAGTLDLARIPTMDAAHIPNLAGEKITTGTVAAARISSAVKSDGPTAAAYARGATGSAWYSVWMNSSLQFMRNDSSRRYKKNIKDWRASAAESALQLRPVIYDRKGADAPKNEVGFIAEEVHEIIPEAVTFFDGLIDGINDRPLIAALTALCQAQQKQIDELTRRFDEKGL